MRQELTRRLERPGLRFGRLLVSSRLCLVILVLVALAAIFAPLLSRYSPTQTGLSQPTVVDGINVPFHAPDGDFWFGTDNSGRDIFSRVLYGARGSLVIGLGATLLALVIASVLGSIAATAGKVVSEVGAPGIMPPSARLRITPPASLLCPSAAACALMTTG